MSVVDSYRELYGDKASLSERRDYNAKRIPYLITALVVIAVGAAA